MRTRSDALLRVPRRRRGVAGLSAIAVGVVLTLFMAAVPAGAQSYPSEAGQFVSSILVWNWYSSPSGANTGCKPSSAHPYPVILTEGTFSNMYNSFGVVAPYLANAGYCVYTFNYGQTIDPSMFDAMGSIPSSASQLESEVNSVLSTTGASKVDIVGWSQGGMMPRYYINDLGGASKVNMLVGLAPSNYGTTVDGLTDLVADFGLFGVATALLAITCTACVQQLQGSSFLTSLNASPTNSSVKYWNIESKVDDVISPYTNAFLPSASNVVNITLQNQCSQDDDSHLAIPYDGNAMQDVVNALNGGSSSFQPSCSSSGWLSGNL